MLLYKLWCYFISRSLLLKRTSRNYVEIGTNWHCRFVLCHAIVISVPGMLTSVLCQPPALSVSVKNPVKMLIKTRITVILHRRTLQLWHTTFEIVGQVKRAWCLHYRDILSSCPPSRRQMAHEKVEWKTELLLCQPEDCSVSPPQAPEHWSLWLCWQKNYTWRVCSRV